jgi:mono/diheme cytochrome c family protein
MKRLVPTLALIVGVMLVIAALAAVQLASAQEGQGGGESGPGAQSADLAALRGAAVYAEFCQACHGPQGEAIGTGPAFAAIQYQAATARDVVVNGKASDTATGPGMPPYGKILDQGQIDDVLAYMATWSTGQTPPLPEPNIGPVPEQVPGYFGDPAAGAVVYARFCNGCHGPHGEGRAKPDFPPLQFTHDTLVSTRDGTANIYMPAFGAAAGGPLTDQQLTDLETYMASWSLKAPSTSTDRGVSLLLVVTGILAITTVGGVYLSRTAFYKYSVEDEMGKNQ